MLVTEFFAMLAVCAAAAAVEKIFPAKRDDALLGLS